MGRRSLLGSKVWGPGWQGILLYSKPTSRVPSFAIKSESQVFSVSQRPESFLRNFFFQEACFITPIFAMEMLLFLTTRRLTHRACIEL